MTAEKRNKPEFALANRLALTVEEAAATIGVSERHLRTMLPEIPHCRVGARVVIPVEPLKEWLRGRAQTEKAGADQVAQEILDELGR
jgi:excisionase family DNA binding protein